ncbi:MAG: hypothetical protein Q8N47_20300 [Bryobacterales bacterium]|nr:hypothetical protein [Bryobacterales bacterium]
MSIEGELLQLARERETETQDALARMLLDPPHILGRQLRDYLSRQVDRGRIRHANEKVLQLNTLPDSLSKLACSGLAFSSGARLKFEIQIQKDQRGCFLRQFQFRLHSPNRPAVEMVRIELEPETQRDPLVVPRCHLHIGGRAAHVPFPIMHPVLILYLICEHIERG